MCSAHSSMSWQCCPSPSQPAGGEQAGAAGAGRQLWEDPARAPLMQAHRHLPTPPPAASQPEAQALNTKQHKRSPPAGQRHTKPLNVSTQALSACPATSAPRQHESVLAAHWSTLSAPVRQMGGSLRRAQGREWGREIEGWGWQVGAKRERTRALVISPPSRSPTSLQPHQPATHPAHLPSEKPEHSARSTAGAASEPRYWSELMTTC